MADATAEAIDTLSDVRKALRRRLRAAAQDLVKSRGRERVHLNGDLREHVLSQVYDAAVHIAVSQMVERQLVHPAVPRYEA
jgi:uncharacterized protein with gpF-like domain